ncbi:MAG: hypothetical protein NW224_12735 [Leptolyngbyaceae cyanobacterium bins.302]|nr:hypothetical protein [Leptolyngbyaceae cyanobacterium bins.302]
MTTLNQWLTLQAAAEVTQTDITILQDCLKANPEKQFHKYGLLYDRDRRESGETAYLQQLEPVQPGSSQAKTSNEVSDRTYTWNNTPIRLEILWLPSTDGQEGKVLISATSYDDFPVSDLIAVTQLDALPAPLLALLDELKADLPIRKLRYQQQQSKEQRPTNRPVPLKPATATPVPTFATSKPSTQIKLF